MIIVQHRVNTLKDLKTVPLSFGIELDVRYHNDELILDHDPFCHHTKVTNSFEDILKLWEHKGPLIVNLKSEGIEAECIRLLNKYKVKSWFFLDLSMPYFVKYSKLAREGEIENFNGENLAVRFSEFEPIEYALSFAQEVSWVWVDCFNGKPIDRPLISKLKEAGFKLCFVSPELQQYSKETAIKFRQMSLDYEIDAVCTKYPDVWT